MMRPIFGTGCLSLRWPGFQVRCYGNAKKLDSFNKKKTLKTPQSVFSKKKRSTDPNSLKPYKFGSDSGLNLPNAKQRESTARFISKITDFNELKILPEIRTALINEVKAKTVLRSQNNINSDKKQKTEGELNGLIIRPTPIQTAAIKAINDNSKENFRAFTLAAETGSGKTWAYLAPLLQKLKDQQLLIEQQAQYGQTKNRQAGIKSVILLPTHELVDQVHETVSKVVAELDMKSYKWSSNTNFNNFRDKFSKGIDVFVTTPQKLDMLTKYDDVPNPRMILGSSIFCVVDEADTLMDPSFLPHTAKVLNYMTNLRDVVFVSATLPNDFQKVISKMYPAAVPIVTPNLHKLPKSIEFRVINAALNPFKGSKMKALAQALYAIHCDGTEKGYEKRVIVFVNTKEDCVRVAEKLEKEYGHDVTSISSENVADVRKMKIQPFIEAPKLLEDPTKPTLKVLVCTDLVSRGLNFVGVRNVVLLDAPKTSIDLLHRAGRTGRMNQSGRVFMIIDNKDSSHIRGLPKALRNRRRLG